MPSASLWLLAIWQSIPSRLKATQDHRPIPYRQPKAYRRGLVPRRGSSSESSVCQKCWLHQHHPSNLPVVPTSAIGSLAPNNGKVPWARTWLLQNIQAKSTRTNPAETISNRRHRAIDAKQRPRPCDLRELSMHRMPRPTMPIPPQPAPILQ